MVVLERVRKKIVCAMRRSSFESTSTQQMASDSSQCGEISAGFCASYGGRIALMRLSAEQSVSNIASKKSGAISLSRCVRVVGSTQI